jgi:hypothetical protein
LSILVAFCPCLIVRPYARGPKGTYTLTFTGRFSTLQHSAAATLIVQSRDALDDVRLDSADVWMEAQVTREIKTNPVT